MVLKAKIIYFVIILFQGFLGDVLGPLFFFSFVFFFRPFIYFQATEKPVEPKFYGYLTFGHNVILR